MKDWRSILEKQAFGVCSFLADSAGWTVDRVRLYFVYLSLLTFGSPVIIYLFFAFWIHWKQLVRGRRPLHYL